MRRALLVEAVLQLLAIELDERLSRRDAVAEIGSYPANHAVNLGRHDDLVLGRQRPDYFESTSDRLLANRFGLDGLGRLLRPASRFRARVCTSGHYRHQSPEHDQYEGTLRHKDLILIRADARNAREFHPERN